MDAEFIHSRRLAQVVLDQPSRDPDGDLSVLARQLQRADERNARLAAALLFISLNTCCGDCREAALVARQALGSPSQPIPTGA